MTIVTADAIVETTNTDPFVQQLLEAPIPARIAYIGLDGTPRVVPVSYLWDGAAFVFASPPDWYKVRAMAANPNVALTVDSNDFPPLILSAHGVASIEYDQGLPGSTSSIGASSGAKVPGVGEEVRAENRNMALITSPDGSGRRFRYALSGSSPQLPSPDRLLRRDDPHQIAPAATIAGDPARIARAISGGIAKVSGKPARRPTT